MTWYFDPDGDRMDVYDHTGELVEADTPINYDDAGEPVGVYGGNFPDRVKDIAYEQMDGSQPSAYNQQLVADMACEQIEQGTPPAQS